MLKQLRKLVLYSCIFSFLAFCPVVIANNNQIQDIKQNGQLNLVQNDVKINDFETSPINTQKVKKNVVPDTKKEGAKVINLFLKVMMAVLLSAGILYVVLLFIKKYYGSAFAVEEYDEFENLNLTPPDSKENALKSFLNRTK